jgi:hypothetical protein
MPQPEREPGEEKVLTLVITLRSPVSPPPATVWRWARRRRFRGRRLRRMRSAFSTYSPVPRRFGSVTGKRARLSPFARLRRVKTIRVSGNTKTGCASRVLNAPPSKCGCRRNGNPSRSDGPRAEQPLTITGNRFTFDDAGFAPASGTVYAAATHRVPRLDWESNQAESPAVLYTVDADTFIDDAKVKA